MDFKDILKYVAAVGGSFITYLLGGWSALIQTLVAFVVVDYVTGVLAASIKKEISSQIGMIGIAKKVLIFVLVACGHLVDLSLGTADVVRNAVICFYIANELFSILENAGKAGLSVPDILKSSVDKLKGKENGTESKDK